jgi:hypothetical protein
LKVKNTHKLKTHKLVCEIEHNYNLIGIHTTLEDYRLAYFLNEMFTICLEKFEIKMTFPNHLGLFSIYEFNDLKEFCIWSLVKNNQVSKDDVNIVSQTLFLDIENYYTLINEYKRTDFFLKIDGEFNPESIEKSIKKIIKINGVQTAFQLNPKTLKSKDYLIY